GLALSPDGGNSVGFTARSRVHTSSVFGDGMPFAYTVTILFVDTTVHCLASVDTTRSGAPDLGVTGVLHMVPTGDATQMVRAATEVVGLDDLDEDDVEISGGLVCDVADVLKGFFMDTVRETIRGRVAGAIDAQLCQPCAQQSDCAPFGQCSGGVCMRGSQCL